MMTMDTQSSDVAQGGCWGSQAPASPPAGDHAGITGAAGRRAVSVIRVHHPLHLRDDTPRLTRMAVDRGAAATERSPSRLSSDSSSSECGSRGHPDRALDSPEETLPVGYGRYSHPAARTYPFCDVSATPTSLLPGLSSAASGTQRDPLRDPVLDRRLYELYDPVCSLGAGPPYPLRGVFSWHGLGMPSFAPHYPVTTPVPPPVPPLRSHTYSNGLKFGMDRILSEEGCGRTSSGETMGCSQLDCGSQITSIGELAYPGLLAPTPLRIYSHVSDARTSSASGAVAQLPPLSSHTGGKRKRSWSRAVFSNLQRKGLEKRFQLQKYITKPDRRQLAATLGLTDAQVKVWFQNRRMKWRHTKESKQQAQRLDGQDLPKADTSSLNS